MFLFDLVGLNIFHVGHSHTLPPWHVPNILWTWKLGLGSKHIIQKFVATPTDLEKVMFMPRFVMFFYESWRTNNQYSCAQYTVYSVHENFSLSCHLPMSLQLNEFQKRQRAEICHGRHANATCSPDPSKPQPLRSLIGGSLADSVGFHVCHIGHSHLSWKTGWMTWIIFLTQRLGMLSLELLFHPTHIHCQFSRLNQQHLPSLRNPPSTSSRAISACHGRHVSDPSQSDLLV